MKAASELYLATDEDREGEAIAWHLLEVLNPPSGMPVRRMVFHEITPEAIQRAIDEPREIDRRLVDAQEARRILDRLYGYEVSPVLWKKVQSGLSAGRVQSVATRIVVERERARMRFTVASYWDLDGQFAGGEPKADFGATLVAVDGARAGHGQGLRRERPAPGRRRPAGRGRRPRPGRRPGRRRLRRPLGRVQALHPQAVRAVHDLDPPAGGRAQAALRLGPHHGRRPAPLRERLHHLHADRQHDAVGHRGVRRPQPRSWRSTARTTCPTPPGSTPARSRTPRRPTRPSARPATASASPRRSSASCRATSSASTSWSGGAPSPPR